MVEKVGFRFVGDNSGNFFAWAPNGNTHKLAGIYYPAADYEALEAKLAALEQAAQRLVDHAQNAKQELWASLPDVINLRDVLEGKEK